MGATKFTKYGQIKAKNPYNLTMINTDERRLKIECFFKVCVHLRASLLIAFKSK
jgi:hypothetical protein